jgi:putative membrane protein
MYPGFDGFLGTRASWMLDFVAVALVFILGILAASIWLVRYRRAYRLHKGLQLSLGILLAAAVALFEVDVRLHGWQDRARASSYFGTTAEPGLLFDVLYVHLFFSITTTLLWIYVIVQALRKFPRPVAPGTHSAAHRRWAWIAALAMLGTAVTGWLFYWMAFVA